MLIEVPESWRSKLNAQAPPAMPTDAASIVLLRREASGAEVFLMRRQPTMRFASGMHVFPGGGVQESDYEKADWIGPDAAYFARRFDCTESQAAAVVTAAIREVFEETGVLFAANSNGAAVEDVRSYHDSRLALERHELTFSDFLRRERLVLFTELLLPWSHWITPAFEPRRFDTHFFVAELPQGQAIERVSNEADDAGWIAVDEVMSSPSQSHLAMLPPTRQTIHELASVEPSSLSQVAEARTIRPIVPRLESKDGLLFLNTDTDSDVDNDR